MSMTPRYRPRWVTAVGTAGGALAAVALVTGVYLAGAGASVLVPAGTRESVPGYQNRSASEGGYPQCVSTHDCGHAGVLELWFTLGAPAALLGVLAIPTPVTLVVGDAVGLSGLAPSWYWPGPNGTAPPGGAAYAESNVSGYVSLSALELGLEGQNNVVPAGAWALCFVNWGATPVNVTVVDAVAAAPR